MYKSLLIVSLFSLSASAMAPDKKEGVSAATKVTPVSSRGAFLAGTGTALFLTTLPTPTVPVVVVGMMSAPYIAAAAVIGATYYSFKQTSCFGVSTESKK